MATPLYDKDLSKILAAGVTLTTSHIQYFIYQLLCALKYMHRCVSCLEVVFAPPKTTVMQYAGIALILTRF